MNRAVQETTRSKTRRLGGVTLWLLSALFSTGACANILDITVTGGGSVDDLQLGISCTDAGGAGCQFDSADATITANLVATPQAGFFFQGWGGECAIQGANPTCPVRVLAGAAVQTVSAVFAPNTATLTVALTGSGAGNVQSDPSNPGIDCPGDCSEVYSIDVNVTLTATPTSPTSTFTGWSGGGCTGTGTCTIGILNDLTVQANFENDADGDGVFDPNDLCPNTPPNTPVDADGCSQAQQDEDGDGVANGIDQCPGTPAGVTVDATGCSEVQQFGNELGELPGLGTSQRRFGRRLDEICPQLVAEGDAGRLNESQQDLREACSRLKNRGTTEAQAADGLNDALVFQLPAMQMYMVELTQSQSRHLRNRMQERRSGGGSGASVAGLNIRVGGETVPSAAVQSALEGLLGIGASEEPFADFGKLGLFLQGDIDTGDRDDDNNLRGYDFDTWNITFGGDYRFTQNFFAGGSVSYGEVEVDHQANRGETDVDQWALTLYAGWQITEGWFLDGMLSYGESDFDLERNISYVDVGGTFESSHGGDTDGDQVFFGLNTGYTWNKGGWRFGPVASFTSLNGTIDEYTEATISGSDAWNFIIEERDIESLRFSAGLQVDYIISTSWGVLIPGLRASYVMENEDEDENIKVRLANNPFAESSLASDRIIVDVDARDDAFIDASFNLSAQFPMGVSGFFSYNFYSAYDNFSKDAFTIGVRWDKPF